MVARENTRRRSLTPIPKQRPLIAAGATELGSLTEPPASVILAQANVDPDPTGPMRNERSDWRPAGGLVPPITGKGRVAPRKVISTERPAPSRAGFPKIPAGPTEIMNPPSMQVVLLSSAAERRRRREIWLAAGLTWLAAVLAITAVLIRH
ncbi:MAG: hypothetical protein U1E65_08610 [Myxococcota bacterium]